MHSRRTHKIIRISSLLFVLSAASLWFFLYMRPNHAKTLPDTPQQKAGTTQNNTTTLITATGVTTAGMDIITLPTDTFAHITLYVEDVYPADGDTVAAGEKYIKFTDDSITMARVALEKAIQDADLAYRSKAIANGESQIQARYAYDMALLDAKFAQQIYQDTLEQLELALTRTKNAYQKAQATYNAYLLAVENNTFYDDFGIEQLKKAYYDAYDLYANRKKYLELSEDEQSALSARGQEDYQWILKTLSLLKEESEESREEYEQARQNYQSEIEHAEFKLHNLLNQFEQAKQAYTDAQLAYQKEGLRAKTAFELSSAKGEVAENIYNAQIISLQNELDQLVNAKEKAVNNKISFELLVGDGYLHTEAPGAIAMLPVQKEQALTGGDTTLAYNNAEKLFVTASIAEREVAQLFIGEMAAVTIAGYGCFDGVIETIQPVTSAYSTVVISLKGDISAISPDLTATVTFAPPDNEGQQTTPTTNPVLQMYDFALSTWPHSTDPKQQEAIEVYAAQDAASPIWQNTTSTEYLKIAEIYTVEGAHICQGDPVCRFTPDSVEAVRQALTCAQSEALAALMETQADSHIGILNAALSHNEALLDKALAQRTYDNTIARLNTGIAAKILETEQLLTDIYQMQLSLTDDAYRKQQAEITSAYNAAKRQLAQARENFVTNQVEAAKVFQAAKKSYDTFISQLKASNQQMQEKATKVYVLQEEILQSQQMMEKERIAAEQARSSSQTAGEVAYTKYTDSVKKYENALNAAQVRSEQATQKLNDFNQFVGDGTIYATEDGLVMEIGYRKGDLLTDTQNLIFYTPEAADLETVE